MTITAIVGTVPTRHVVWKFCVDSFGLKVLRFSLLAVREL